VRKTVDVESAKPCSTTPARRRQRRDDRAVVQRRGAGEAVDDVLLQPGLPRAGVMLPASEPNSTASEVAAPSVPPRERKKVTDEVATPMSCGGRAFWTLMTSVCIDSPSPPHDDHVEHRLPDGRVDAEGRHEQQRGEHQRRADDRQRLVPAGAAHDLPGEADVTMMPTISGMSCSPPRSATSP
jgi:hypothetical protein